MTSRGAQPVTRSLYCECGSSGGARAQEKEAESSRAALLTVLILTIPPHYFSSRKDITAEGAHGPVSVHFVVCYAFLSSNRRVHRYRRDRTCHGARTTKPDPARRGAATNWSQSDNETATRNTHWDHRRLVLQEKDWICYSSSTSLGRPETDRALQVLIIAALACASVFLSGIQKQAIFWGWRRRTPGLHWGFNNLITLPGLTSLMVAVCAPVCSMFP